MIQSVKTPVQSALENIRYRILQESWPENHRLELLGAVDFFCKQILCETERRAPDAVLRQRWRQFERQFVYGRPDGGIRERILICGSLRRFFHPPVRPERAKEEADLAKLFRHLQKQVKEKARLNEIEKSLCVLGLRYLECEAERPLPQRPVKRIRQTWKQIHPLLKEGGVLRQVRGVNFEMKLLLMHFLLGEGESAA